MSRKTDISKLTVSNDLSYSPVVTSYVKAVAQKLGFEEDDLSMIELGVDEAFTNVVEHAFDADEDVSFDIICRRIPLGLQIAIREQGMPFDPSKIPEYDPNAALEDQSGAGLGSYLMKQTMNEVHFNNLGKQGKETLMIKFLQSKSVEDYFDSSELERFEKPGEKKAKTRKRIELKIARVTANDAIEVSRCVYRTYGYSYDKEHAYYPERIVELNETGLMISALAVTEEGEMTGHCALMKNHSEDKIAEIGMAVVKPKFRGKGCMKFLSSFLMEEAKTAGLIGIFAQAVSNHPFSQKTMHNFGFYDCGMLLANVPTTRSFKGITDKLSQRESYVISYQYLNKPESLTIYAPPHHKQMIEKIYENIDIKPDFKFPDWVGYGGETQFKADESALKSKVYTGKGIAYIEIPQFGKDIVKQVRARLRDLCLKKIEAIYLYLSLQRPETYSLTPEFEKMGFFFGGIFPATTYGDALILQYLNNVEIDHSKIALVSDMAKDLSAYVQKQDPSKKE